MKKLIYILILCFLSQTTKGQVSIPPTPINTNYYVFNNGYGTTYGYYRGYRYYYHRNYRYENQNYNYYYPSLGTLLGQTVVSLISYAIYDNILEQKVVWQKNNITYETTTTPLLGWKYTWNGTEWVYGQVVIGYTWWNGNSWISYYYPSQ